MQKDGGQGPPPLDEVFDGHPSCGEEDKRAEDVCRGKERRPYEMVHFALARGLQQGGCGWPSYEQGPATYRHAEAR